MQKPTVAIFGGSFDPPHQGHQKVVSLALKILAIDTLLVLPAYLSPFKASSFSSATQRLAWCQVLFEDIPHVQVEDYEIKEEKSTTTLQSVKYFNQYYNVKYLIIGADNLVNIEKWTEFQWLNTHLTWVIATRKGYTLKTDKLKTWIPLEVHEVISSTYLRTTQQLTQVDTRIKDSVKKSLQSKKDTPYMTINERIDNIINLLDSKKAEEIEVFDLENADYIAKRVIIANSLNGKHTIALFEYLKKELKTTNDEFFASDVSDDWVVGDLGDILIHIMVPEYRQRYSLEQFLSELVESQKKSE